MSGERSPEALETVAEYVLGRYDPHVAALMAYGSRVFGRARVGSAYDFWLIVRDLEAFHRANAAFYRTQLNVASTPEEQIELNRSGPLFYSLHQEEWEIKLAVLDEENLVRFCADAWWTVKGRMQKPMRTFRTTPRVEQAIQGACREALSAGLNLVPPVFTMDQLLREIVGLSYRAEIRPERKGAKIGSILDAGRSDLEKMYRPLLAELPHVEPQGDCFADRRPSDVRAQARQATLRALRRSKWSGKSLRYIWRNYRSHGKPIRYLLMKVAGEFQKMFKR